MKKNKIDEIHYLRGLSIALILSSHLLYADQKSSFYFFVSAFFENSTLFFGFISGFLFQYLLGKYEYTSYLKRKFKYVILPYLLISIPIIILRVLSGPSFLAQKVYPEIIGEPKAIQFLYYFISGTHLVPYWYLPMIALFFLLAPVFKIIDQSPVLYWILPLLFAIAQVFPRDEFEDIANTLMMFGHFLFIYVFGMFAAHYKERFYLFLTNYRVLIITIFLFLFISTTIEIPFRAQVIYLQKIFALFVLIDLFKWLHSPTLKKLYAGLADTSFGIYFIHFILILGLREISFRALGHKLPASVVEWLISVVFILVLSHLIVHLVKRILGRYSRLLIGS